MAEHSGSIRVITNRFSRRDFLKITAFGGAAALALRFGLDIKSHTTPIRETRLLMGTVVNLTIISDDRQTAKNATTACFDHMAKLEAVLSRFQPQSQLSKLNQSGVVADAHPALLVLIKQSQELSQLTSGAFDITVKPLLDLYQAAPSILPTDQQIEVTLGRVDYRKIAPSGQGVAFQQPGMSITLDGIAKGFIVDEGVAILKKFGFQNVLVEAGGDLMGLGEKARQAPWKIGLQAPRKEMGSMMTTFNVQNQALATSGDYMQTFTLDYSEHHIIDPHRGHSPSELASASIFAPTAALADGLATAVMVMGTQGIHLIENMPDCEAYLITKKLDVLVTSGLVG
jgi:thiamine biosynthesis lipoprotein